MSMAKQWLSLAAVAALMVLAPPVAAARQGAPGGVALSDIGTFFVGGHYAADSKEMTGQAHVLYLIPTRRTHATPIIFIPGLGQTITNFLSTPDGKSGWAWAFVRQGYAVYLMDQPGRGASGYADAYGPPSRQDPLSIEQRFTAPEKFTAEPGKPIGWPQARRHTQWPGIGQPGDPAFDQFFASQVASPSGGVSATLVADAGAALLDRIGPAIVVTHSQAGAFGWAIGEARPSLVRAVVAIEPSGPPFYSAPAPWGDGDPNKLTRRWGLTSTPLSYTPALKDPADLAKAQQVSPDAPGLVRCWLQAEPARKLTNLSRFPVMVLVSDASYHSGYDHCTARYLRQAGVSTDLISLPQRGIFGNGHMMMLERNNQAIARVVLEWLTRRAPDSAKGGKSRRR
jgi:pimeloyl-ACP methyl ester carboxylesterase